MNRRRFLKSAAAGGAIAAFGVRSPSIAQGARVLRFIPQANLTSLDPIWTTATITLTHGYHVYDTLYGVDAQFRPKPQMAEGHNVSADGRTWTFRLREGLRFHDNEPVRAQDCVPSIERWGKRDAPGQVLMRVTESVRALDDRTIEWKLQRPFPQLLDVLAKPQANGCFIMPERVARTDAMQQITDYTGSGPFRFVRGEFVSGSRVVYTRFEGYAPRQEPAEWTSGGKVAHFDRIEWLIIPDSNTAAAALQSGEADWWEIAQQDLLPVLRRNRNVRVAITNPTGASNMMRFNHLQPPFNNAAIRRALLLAVNQEDYMRAAMGEDPQGWRTCYSMFPCGTTYGTDVAAEPLKGPRDIDAARAALRAAGYANQTVVILSPTDLAFLRPLGNVTADLFQRLGMNVDLVETDWGTVVQRRASREPVERGGWSIFHTNWTGASVINPLINPTLRGNGLAAWVGWPDDPKSEELHAAWLEAPTEAEQRRIAAEIQRNAFEQAPIIPLGQSFLSAAYRTNLTGVLDGASPYPWNVRRA
jgi:peptide/nickel transport system substrate-binding protein